MHQAPATLRVELLSHPEGEMIAALAAKLCYSDASIASLKEAISAKEQDTFIKMISRMGHHSVLEHLSFTFGVEGVSRTLTHQLVRHRIASYSQKSQRYVTHDNFEYIMPPSVAQKPEAANEYVKIMEEIRIAYTRLKDLDLPAEDVRYVLPNACETKIIVTMNARELLHFFRLRCCERAQWEIRAMAVKMLKLALPVAPSVFAAAGPACVSGKCSEGKMTCGKPDEIREKFKQIVQSVIR